MRNLVTEEEGVPTWAIVLAIVGFFVVCILSLLLLLVKEKKVAGLVEVTVTNGDFVYQTQLPVSSGAQVNQIHQAVAVARQYAG